MGDEQPPDDDAISIEELLQRSPMRWGWFRVSCVFTAILALVIAPLFACIEVSWGANSFWYAYRGALFVGLIVFFLNSLGMAAREWKERAELLRMLQSGELLKEFGERDDRLQAIDDLEASEEAEDSSDQGRRPGTGSSAHSRGTHGSQRRRARRGRRGNA